MGQGTPRGLCSAPASRCLASCIAVCVCGGRLRPFSLHALLLPSASGLAPPWLLCRPRATLPTSPLPSSSLRSPSWPRAFLIRLRAFLRTQRIATNLAPLRVFTTLVYLLLSFFEQPAWW